MNILLFIITIIISFIVVRIGAIAFQITGLEWTMAKFQALSCFTGTGFTTREAELITGNPRRRRLASIIMVLGNVGFIALIATFANSIRPKDIPSIKMPFVHLFFPAYLLPWINLIIIMVSTLIVYKIFSRSKFKKRFTEMLKKRLIKKELVKAVTFEELLVSTGGYGISNIEICEKSPVRNSTIKKTEQMIEDINILVLEKKGYAIPNPGPDVKIAVGDRLVCFGKLEEIRNKICPE